MFVTIQSQLCPYRHPNVVKDGSNHRRFRDFWTSVIVLCVVAFISCCSYRSVALFYSDNGIPGFNQLDPISQNWVPFWKNKIQLFIQLLYKIKYIFFYNFFYKWIWKNNIFFYKIVWFFTLFYTSAVYFKHILTTSGLFFYIYDQKHFVFSQILPEIRVLYNILYKIPTKNT